jgi:hypothetical protein
VQSKARKAKESKRKQKKESKQQRGESWELFIILQSNKETLGNNNVA